MTVTVRKNHLTIRLWPKCADLILVRVHSLCRVNEISFRVELYKRATYSLRRTHASLRVSNSGCPFGNGKTRRERENWFSLSLSPASRMVVLSRGAGFGLLSSINPIRRRWWKLDPVRAVHLVHRERSRRGSRVYTRACTRTRHRGLVINLNPPRQCSPVVINHSLTVSSSER